MTNVILLAIIVYLLMIKPNKKDISYYLKMIKELTYRNTCLETLNKEQAETIDSLLDELHELK